MNMNIKLETRSEQTENADPNLEVRNAVTELRTAAEAHAARLAEQVTALQTRLDAVEIRSQRIPQQQDQTGEAETRALASFLRTGNETEIRAAATDNNADGAWFVLPTVDTAIRELMTDLSPMRGLAEVVTISTAGYERFYSFGKRGATWTTERGEKPQDTARPELKKATFGVAEMYAAPAATRTQLDDAAIDIAAWLIRNATHEFAETEGEAFMTGDGIDNSPRGLLTYPTSVEKDFVRAWGKFQYVPTLTTSSMLTEQWTLALVKLVNALRRPYRGNAVFLMNQNTATVLRTLVDANGRYLWAPTGNLIEGVEHPLLGYRVEIDDSMPDIEVENATPIAFGDFRAGYVIVDRQGIRVERDGVTQKGKVLFDTYKRVGGGAGDFNAIKFLKTAAA